MSVAFEDAMSTLTGMFPDLSRDTIARTLSDCNYHLERTVEALLSAGTAPEIIEQPGVGPAVHETEFETLEERRDLMLAIQLQRDEDLNAKRLKAAEAEELRQNPSRKEHIIPYDYQSAGASRTWTTKKFSALRQVFRAATGISATSAIFLRSDSI
jgi:hypothetical protein